MKTILSLAILSSVLASKTLIGINEQIVENEILSRSGENTPAASSSNKSIAKFILENYSLAMANNCYDKLEELKTFIKSYINTSEISPITQLKLAAICAKINNINFSNPEYNKIIAQSKRAFSQQITSITNATNQKTTDDSKDQNNLQDHIKHFQRCLYAITDFRYVIEKCTQILANDSTVKLRDKNTLSRIIDGYAKALGFKEPLERTLYNPKTQFIQSDRELFQKMIELSKMYIIFFNSVFELLCGFFGEISNEQSKYS